MDGLSWLVFNKMLLLLMIPLSSLEASSTGSRAHDPRKSDED